MNAKVIMFHYVRPENSNNLKFLNYFSLDKFCDFLDKLIVRLKLISPEAYLDSIINKEAIPENALLLSFDDGLYDHYKWVYPELFKRGLGAFFFINTGPILQRDLLQVHKIHALSGLLGYRELKAQFINKICLASEFDINVFENPNAINAYPYDESDIAGFKYGLNYKLPKDILKNVLNDLLNENFNFNELFNDFYLNESQIKEMYDKGMTIGYHGHSHKPFSGLTNAELQSELNIEYDFFRNLGIEARCLSYPYGDTSSVNTHNIEVVFNKGIQVAFMAEKSSYYPRLQLPRIDCKEILKGTLL
jgi:peptidoglycan/xylan/chitin deacetylase (PgdA/CDA1 family)